MKGDYSRGRRRARSRVWPLIPAFVLLGALCPSPAGAATIIVDDAGDASTADEKCTLREAITTSNANAQVPSAKVGDCAAGDPGPVRDVIEFELGGAFPVIKPSSALPVISDRLEVDGRNGSVVDVIRIQIDGTELGGGDDGFFLSTDSDGSYLHHLAVFNFPDDGFHLFSNGNTIERVISGMDQAGTSASANGGNGVAILGDENAVERSVISGNTMHGVSIEPLPATTGAGTTIRGNRIGTTKDGTEAVPNGLDGVQASLNTLEPSGAPADNIVIGGTTDPTPGGECDGDCNLISGNTRSGVEVVVFGPEPGRADGLRIEGNFLGTDITGMAAKPNSPAAGQGAVKLVGATDGAAIRGNLISGNGDDGIALLAGDSSDIGPTDTAVTANTIGLAVDGETALANVGQGVLIDRSLLGGPPLTGTVIGGTVDPTPGGACDGDCNLISGNAQSGITLFDTSSEGGPIADTAILGNYIGTDAGGALDVGNEAWGIQLSGVSGTTVGQPGSPNVISGNGTSGVLLLGGLTTENVIQSNLIGLGANGTVALGNDDHGVEAGFGPVSQNTIGGIGAGLANTIAHNGDAGVMLGGGGEPVIDIPVLGNSIFSNGGLGIDLRPDLISGGVTENGACSESEVANRCQEFPALSAAVGGSAVAAGTLASDPGKSFRIEVFANSSADPSGNGEGERFLGAVDATTDGAGNATWLFADPAGTLADGEQVTATATELGGGGTPLSTSEFSDSLAAPTCHLSGDGGDNALSGGDGGEVICGLGGNDTIDGGGGGDALLGGEGDDTIDAADGEPDALIDCGPGTDTASVDSADVDPDTILVGCETVDRPTAAVVDLQAAAVTRKCGGKKATIVGTSGADKLNGTKKRDVISGLGGNDTIKGVAGNDLLCGGGGNDKIFGHGGKDKLYGGDGNDVLKGGTGKDLLKGNDGKDTLNAGKGPHERCDGGRGHDKSKAPGCEKRQRLP
jgi:RTX calcium-binding nonapeptide repeat (4 copies)